jgi:hypothetical protein
MATKRKNQHSSQLYADPQSLERLFEKLLLKDSFPPPKTFCNGRSIEEHLGNVRRYIHATNITNVEAQIAVLVNSLEEDVQVILFSQPQYEQNSDNYEWLSEKLVTLFRQKPSAVSPLANLLQMKQTNEQSLRKYASDLRITAYKSMKDISENMRETYLLTAFLKGMQNRILAKAIEALKPKAMEEALRLAEKEERHFPLPTNHYVRGFENEDVSVSKNDLRLILNQLSLLQKQVNYLISLQQNRNVNKESNVFQNSNKFRAPLQKENRGRFDTDQVIGRPPIVCYRCNEKGHFARNCKKILTCSLCKGNHLSKNCLRNNKHVRRFHESNDNAEDHIMSDIESVKSAEPSKKGFREETSSQLTENDCFVLATERKTSSVIKPSKTKVFKKPSYLQRQVEAWANYIEGRGNRPKPNHAPTVISTSHSEKAANKPLIQGYCEGKETRLFLDSGAEVNVIDRAFLQELQMYTDFKIQCKSQRGTISCANGSKMETHGLASLKIQVGDSVANLHFVITSNLFPKIIIGIRGMKTLNIQLDPVRNCAIASGAPVPFVSRVSPQSIWPENEERSALRAQCRSEAQKRLH